MDKNISTLTEYISKQECKITTLEQERDKLRAALISAATTTRDYKTKLDALRKSNDDLHHYKDAFEQVQLGYDKLYAKCHDLEIRNADLEKALSVANENARKDAEIIGELSDELQQWKDNAQCYYKPKQVTNGVYHTRIGEHKDDHTIDGVYNAVCCLADDVDSLRRYVIKHFEGNSEECDKDERR